MQAEIPSESSHGGGGGGRATTKRGAWQSIAELKLAAQNEGDDFFITPPNQAPVANIPVTHSGGVTSDEEDDALLYSTGGGGGAGFSYQGGRGR